MKLTSLWQQLSKVVSIAAVDLSTWIGAPTPSNICLLVEVIVIAWLFCVVLIIFWWELEVVKKGALSLV